MIRQGGILADSMILAAVESGTIEIDPFDRGQLNPASYDVTLGDRVLVYDIAGGTLDSKEEPKTRSIQIREGGIRIVPGIGYLMHTRERIATRSYVPVLDGKSSVGRLFVKVHETAGYGDPGFDGQYTLEVTCVFPIWLYAGMRIAQVRFHSMVGGLLKPYAGNYVGDASRGPVASRAWRQFLPKDESPGIHPATDAVPRLCGIPAMTLPPCDLEWGHEGDMHAHAGDGFYARDYEDEHHRRQGERSAAVRS